MHIRTQVTRGMEVLARLAGRLPWRKQMAFALLFIGTPFITGDMEYVVLNLVGLGIGALLVVGKVTQSRRQAEAARARQATFATTRRSR